jgi:hypothetical protein
MGHNNSESKSYRTSITTTSPSLPWVPMPTHARSPAHDIYAQTNRMDLPI